MALDVLPARQAGGSLLFDLELEGFEGFVREQRNTAAALDALAALLRALRPAGGVRADAARFYDRVVTDAEAALRVAQRQALQLERPKGGAADAELRVLAEVLACCGHDVLLRAANAPEGDEDSGAGSGSGCVSAAAGTPTNDGDLPARGSLSAHFSSGNNVAAGAAAAMAAVVAAAPAPAPSPGAAAAAALLAPPQHSFVVVRAPDGGELIVDPSFGARFEIPGGSDPLYASVVAALPPVVVATPEGLEPLVRWLCEQMERSFAADGLTGLPLPPWRSPAYLLACWLPEASADTPVVRPALLAPAAAPCGAAA